MLSYHIIDTTRWRLIYLYRFSFYKFTSACVIISAKVVTCCLCWLVGLSVDCSKKCKWKFTKFVEGLAFGQETSIFWGMIWIQIWIQEFGFTFFTCKSALHQCILINCYRKSACMVGLGIGLHSVECFLMVFC